MKNTVFYKLGWSVLSVFLTYLSLISGSFFATDSASIFTALSVSGVAFSLAHAHPAAGLSGVGIGATLFYCMEAGSGFSLTSLALLMMLSVTIQSGMGVYIFRKWVLSGPKPKHRFPQPAGYAVRAFGAAFITSLIGAGICAVPQFVPGHGFLSGATDLFMSRWVGGLAGILILGTPWMCLRKTSTSRIYGTLPGTSVLSLVITGIGLTAWIFMVQQEQRNHRAQLESRADSLSVHLQRHLDSHLQYSRSVAAFFEASNDVTPGEFSRFASELIRGSSAVGSLSYLASVPDKNKHDFEKFIRRRGIADFSIYEQDFSGAKVPVQKREFYVPVVYIHPMADNKAALGFDIHSHEGRREALIESVKVGDSIATRPITLVQGGGKNNSILIIHPVQQTQPDEYEQPRKTAHLDGFASTVVRLDLILNKVLAEVGIRGHEVSLRYHDFPGDPGISVARSQEQGMEETDPVSIPFDYAGRAWSLTLRPLQQGLAILEASARSWLTLLIGFILSLAILSVGQSQANRLESFAKGQNHLKTILNAALDSVIGIDSEGRITDWNERAVSCFGYSHKSAIGKPISDLIIPDRYKQAHLDGMRRYQETGIANVLGKRIEIEAVCEDGTEIPVELSISLVKDDDPRRFVAFLRDISERRKMEKQLRESEKHRAIWQLTGGLAHDFNNLLGVVIGNLDLLEEEESLEPSEEARHMIDTARSAALRGAGVARSLLAVARRQPLEFVVHDLNAVLSETLPLMQTSVGSAVRVELSLYPEPLLVNLDTEGFSNALLNVVINARDAMKDNQNARELEVRSYLAAPDSAVDETRDSTSFAVIEIRDNGSGMSDDVIKMAMEPYFTTKEKGEGTGLGLSMVLGFAEQLGGTVKIESGLGKGSCISLYLPCISEA